MRGFDQNHLILSCGPNHLIQLPTFLCINDAYRGSGFLSLQDQFAFCSLLVRVRLHKWTSVWSPGSLSQGKNAANDVWARCASGLRIRLPTKVQYFKWRRVGRALLIEFRTTQHRPSWIYRISKKGASVWRPAYAKRFHFVNTLKMPCRINTFSVFIEN